MTCYLIVAVKYDHTRVYKVHFELKKRCFKILLQTTFGYRVTAWAYMGFVSKECNYISVPFLVKYHERWHFQGIFNINTDINNLAFICVNQQLADVIFNLRKWILL